MKKKVLIIGSNSFSGQDLIDQLLDHDYKIIGISRSQEKPPLFLKYHNNPNRDHFRFFQYDLNHDMPALCQLMDSEKPSVVVNFAAQSEVAPSWAHPDHWFQTNVVALSKLISHLNQVSYLDRFIQISSPEIYGTCSGFVTEDTAFQPSTPYAVSKAAADLLLNTYFKQYGFPVIFVRSTNVYGPRQQLFKIIPKTILSIKKGAKIALHGGGVAKKSYIHIRDISIGECCILEKGEIGKVYHLSPDQSISIKDLVEKICALIHVDFSDVVEIVEERPGQDAFYELNSQFAKNTLDWKPSIDIQSGLLDVIEWTHLHWDNLRPLNLEYQHKA